MRLINITLFLVKSALVLCVLFLSGCSEDLDGPHRFKFLITANVEVDGELKYGSSVIEVLYNKPKLGGFGASKIKGVRGTMPIIDLGRDKSIALSFETLKWNYDVNAPNVNRNCRIEPVKFLPTSVMFKEDGRFKAVPEVFKELNAIPIGKKFKFLNRSIAVHIIKSKNIESYNKIYNFCHLKYVLGDEYNPVSITIERTEQPLKFLIDDPVPEWLTNWRNTCRTLEDRYKNSIGTGEVIIKLKLKEGYKEECPHVPALETEKYKT